MQMLLRKSCLFLTCGLLGASGVAAQSPAQNEPIVVEGTANLQKQIDRFIKNLTPAPIHGQLSRFETKVCPLAVGLGRDQGALVIARMRRVAEAAHIPLAKSNCRPNVILIVAADKRALLERLERERPYMFPDSWSLSRIHELERNPAPAAAWAIEGVTSADGQALNQGAEVAVNRTFRVGSRLTPSARPYFAAAVVVVQSNALDGLTTTQLADYAAMRAYVRTDPGKLDASTPGTILTLLDTPMGQPVPITLTAWDLSFLKSFYASRENSYSEYQRAQMKGAMKRELEHRQSTPP